MKKIFLLLLISFSAIGQSQLAWLQSRSYSSEYQTILSYAATQGYAPPSPAERVAQDILIRSLVSNGILSKLDVLKVMIGDGSQAFTDVNWVNPSTYKSIRYRSPTWTINGGFTFRAYDTDNNYIDEGYAPNSGPNYTQNSAETIIYYSNLPATFSISLADGTRSDNIGNNQDVFNPLHASTQVNAATNRGANTLVTDAQFDNTNGLYFYGRTSSTSEFVKKGSGSRVTTGSSTSVTPSTYNYYIGCLNEGANGIRSLTQNTRTVGLYASGGVLSTTDEANFKTAWDNYLAAIAAISAPATIGTFYSKTGSSWSNLSDFTTNGITASISSGTIDISGGASNYNQTLDFAFGSTKLAKWSQTVTFKVITTGNGIGFGIRSSNSSNRIDALVQFVSSSGVCNLAVGASHTTGASSSALSLSANDVISLTITLNENVLSVDVYNVTTGSAHKTASYTYPSTTTLLANTGTFSAFQFSGHYQIQSWILSSTEYYRPKLAILGDSKTQWYYASLYRKSFGYLLSEFYGDQNCVILGGGSDRTAEYLLRTNDLVNLIKPQYVLIAGLSNDIRTGVSSGTWQANMASVISTLQAAGITVIFSTGLYETSISQSAVSTWANAGIGCTVWDSNGITIGLNADNVHPNDAGHLTFATSALSSGKLPTP